MITNHTSYKRKDLYTTSTIPFDASPSSYSNYNLYPKASYDYVATATSYAKLCCNTTTYANHSDTLCYYRASKLSSWKDDDYVNSCRHCRRSAKTLKCTKNCSKTVILIKEKLVNYKTGGNKTKVKSWVINNKKSPEEIWEINYCLKKKIKWWLLFLNDFTSY